MSRAYIPLTAILVALTVAGAAYGQTTDAMPDLSASFSVLRAQVVAAAGRERAKAPKPATAPHDPLSQMFTTEFALPAPTAGFGEQYVGIIKGGGSTDNDSDGSYGPTTTAQNMGFFGLRREGLHESWLTKFGGTKLTISFEGLSADGRNFIVRARYENTSLSSMLISQQPYLDVRAELKVDSCDGQSITQPELDDDASIDDLTANLRGLELRHYMRCDLSVFGRIVVGDEVQPGIWVIGLQHGMKLVLLENGTLLMNSKWDFMPEMGGHNYIYLSRPSLQIRFDNIDNSAGAGREQALTGAKTFIALIKEYTQIILLASNTDAVRSSLAVRTFINANGGAMKDSLKQVEQNFGGLSLLEKIWVSQVLNQAYVNAKNIESRIARSKDKLDSTIRSNNN